MDMSASSKKMVRSLSFTRRKKTQQVQSAQLEEEAGDNSPSGSHSRSSFGWIGAMPGAMPAAILVPSGGRRMSGATCATSSAGAVVRSLSFLSKKRPAWASEPGVHPLGRLQVAAAWHNSSGNGAATHYDDDAPLPVTFTQNNTQNNINSQWAADSPRTRPPVSCPFSRPGELEASPPEAGAQAAEMQRQEQDSWQDDYDLATVSAEVVMAVENEGAGSVCEWLLTVAGLRKLEVERARPALEHEDVVTVDRLELLRQEGGLVDVFVTRVLVRMVSDALDARRSSSPLSPLSAASSPPSASQGLIVEPRLLARGTSLTATLPRDFRCKPPTTGAPRKAGAHPWSLQAQCLKLPAPTPNFATIRSDGHTTEEPQWLRKAAAALTRQELGVSGESSPVSVFASLEQPSPVRHNSQPEDEITPPAPPPRRRRLLAVPSPPRRRRLLAVPSPATRPSATRPSAQHSVQLGSSGACDGPAAPPVPPSRPTQVVLRPFRYVISLCFILAGPSLQV